jgi:hypothetical protein
MTDAAKKTAKKTAKKAAAKADDLHENTWFERAARAGFAVNGLLHVLIGVLAISVALGAGADDADPGGALRAVAQTPGGIVLIWVLAAGLAALSLWMLLEAVLAHLLKSEWKQGLTVLAKAVAYGALAVPAVTIGLGGRVDTDSDVREISAFLVQSPLGIVVLIAAGAVVVAIGVFFIVKGVRATFLDDIHTPRGDLGKAVIVLGTVGYIVKGIALLAVGVLVVVTAVTVDPSSAGGLDEAFRSVAELPFGAIMLVLVALGLIVYGLYCFVRARRSNI